MLKIFEHKETRKAKPVLTYPGIEYRIVFKKGAIRNIMRAKGWKSLSEMAGELGLTRSYMTMLEKAKVAVTKTVITRIAYKMGNTDKNWWIYYELVPYGIDDPNHPTWNREKELGQIPYKKFSESAELRRNDYKVETS